jgi:BirA family biotin operon repressor/biotin-[acetyl-CoA-carboxylase] ligase
MDVARENVLARRVRFDAQGRPEPGGVLAREQTAGRGQRGRQWFALPDECLCATYYFQRGPITPPFAGHLAFVAGAAVADTLQSLCRVWPDAPQNVPRVGLKWPNDVLLNGKKAGGILIEMVEMVQQNGGNWVALIGVGINISVREFPPELEGKATSLLREGITHLGYETLGGVIAGALDTYADIRQNGGFEAVLNHWRRYDETPGHVYETRWNGETVRGVAQGVESDGSLCLRLEDNTVISVISASTTMQGNYSGHHLLC